jgi:MFS family permease
MGSIKDARAGAAGFAWLLAAVYYFYQYALRSAPAVMMPQLSDAFHLEALGVASLAGLFYYGYSPFSLVAGVALDRLGPRTVIPVGALLAGSGALLFGTGNLAAANIGRFLQGAGGVFALVGAVYIATKHFPASRAATLIGATQMFGMAGGSAGQFVVGPMIAGGIAWSTFWSGMGVAGLVIGALLFILLPKSNQQLPGGESEGWLRAAVAAMGIVFRNPQSILCGLIAGLLFIPTTIFDMIWGVRYLQDAHGFDYGAAVMRSATVPLGWIIGCPLLGLISDRLGRRKPVIVGGGVLLLGCLAWILYGPAGVFPPYVLGILAGLASGAAMLPYTVIKEANPPQYSGTATGVINFLNFTFSALLGPVFGFAFQTMSGRSTQTPLEIYQTTFHALLYGVALATVLAFLLKETGPAVRTRASQLTT